MRSANTPRYHPIALHGLMLLLFIAVYASIELRVLFAKGTDMRDAFKSAHFMLGLSVFVLVWLRLLARIKYPPPAQQPAWQEKAAKLMHGVFYAFMITMPLAGWLILSAEGQPISFFGLQLPALIGPDKVLADEIQDIHELLGTIGYFLIAAHAALALFHHYIKRDDALLRMLPWR
jgi:cytochrome b561